MEAIKKIYPLQIILGRLKKYKMNIEDIENGEGAVVELDGEKVAVYKDEEGKVRKLEPNCTHLGCTVAWNAEEKTWDCPCHGSRFTKEGEVISGPAQDPLERK